jgi:hypothetical protein
MASNNDVANRGGLRACYGIRYKINLNHIFVYVSHTEQFATEGKTLQVITYLHTIFREIASDNPDLPEKVKVYFQEMLVFFLSWKLTTLRTQNSQDAFLY